MVYRILGEFHYTDVVGNQVVAFPFTVTNDSRQTETFTLFPGFTAVLSTGGYEQFTSYEGPSAQDPKCSPPNTQPNLSTSLGGYKLKPGHSGGPWEACMEVSPGQRIVKAVFADDNPNLHQAAMISLTGNVPQLRTPLPPSTPPGNKGKGVGPAAGLPNPCKLEAAALENVVSASARPSDGALHETLKGTAHARATCRFPVGYGGPNQTTTTNFMPVVYLGYVRPTDNFPYPFFSDTPAAISGFPHANVIDTFDTWMPDDSLRWIIVNFTRRFHGRVVYGQIATTFQTYYWPSCPAANLEANVELAAADLYKSLGPGSAPSPSSPQPLAGICPGQHW